MTVAAIYRVHVRLIEPWLTAENMAGDPVDFVRAVSDAETLPPGQICSVLSRMAGSGDRRAAWMKRACETYWHRKRSEHKAKNSGRGESLRAADKEQGVARARRKAVLAGV